MYIALTESTPETSRTSANVDEASGNYTNCMLFGRVADKFAVFTTIIWNGCFDRIFTISLSTFMRFSSELFGIDSTINMSPYTVQSINKTLLLVGIDFPFATLHDSRFVLKVFSSLFLVLLINCEASLTSALSTMATAWQPCRTTFRLFNSIPMISLSLTAVSRINFVASFVATPKTTVVFCPPSSTFRGTALSSFNVLSPGALRLVRIRWTIFNHIVDNAFSRTKWGSFQVSRIAIILCTFSSPVKFAVIDL